MGRDTVANGDRCRRSGHLTGRVAEVRAFERNRERVLRLTSDELTTTEYPDLA